MPPAFWLWAAWRDKGGLPSKRPKGLPAQIPKAWWARYLIHKGVRKLPLPKPNLGKAQYILFAANDPLSALAAPSKYGVALSADTAFRYDNLRDIIAALRFKGHRVLGWCDCRPVGEGTPAIYGVGFVSVYGLDYFIGQAETPAEFDDAVKYGAEVVVGNITSLLADQVELVRKGKVLLIQEDYWNEGWARAKNPEIAAYCAGIYPTGIWNPTIKTYRDAGRWQEGDGLFHVAAVTDWENLP